MDEEHCEGKGLASESGTGLLPFYFSFEGGRLIILNK